MRLEWMKVIFAGLFEIMWVVGLKHADGLLEWGITLLAIFISFYFLIMAGAKLPAGTVYTVFTGIGAAGTVLMGWFVFNEEMTLPKIILLITLCVGIVGLKTTTDNHKREAV